MKKFIPARMTDDVKKEQRPGISIFTFTLKTGEWRSLFSVEECKILIAEGLNSTVTEHEYRNAVVGYLITEHSVYLVLRIDHKKIRKMFDCFYDKVREGIRNALDSRRKNELKQVLEQEQISREDLFERLFEQFSLKNDHLVKLITGRKVELPYYDPELERLKDKICNDRFCSALDYEGGEGPVLVKLIKKKEWEQEKTTTTK